MTFLKLLLFSQTMFLAFPCEWLKLYLNSENHVRLGAFFSLSPVEFLFATSYVHKIFRHPKQMAFLYKSGCLIKELQFLLNCNCTIDYRNGYNSFRIVIVQLTIEIVTIPKEL
jgi:hypothetical protein